MIVWQRPNLGIFSLVVCLGTFVGVRIKSTRPKIIEIRLKNVGIINCIVIRDANIIVVGAFNVIIGVRFLDNIIVGYDRIKIIFGKIFIFVGRFDIFFQKILDRRVRSPFEKWDSTFDQWLAFFTAMASTAVMTALVMGILVHWCRDKRFPVTSDIKHSRLVRFQSGSAQLLRCYGER